MILLSFLYVTEFPYMETLYGLNVMSTHASTEI